MHAARKRTLGRVTLAALAAILACTRASADTVADVEAATQQWIAAFNRHSATEIVGLYAKDAVFFGTSSPVLRDTPELVWDYFKNIAAQGDATISLGEHRVQVFGKIAVNTGYYIRKTVQAGQIVENPARFTFVYQLRGGKWMIVEHHSSVPPQPPQS